MNLAIGRILKKLRKEQRLKQQYLADYLFVSRPTYVRYESDIVEMPLSKLFELSLLYRIDIADLIRLINAPITPGLGQG